MGEWLLTCPAWLPPTVLLSLVWLTYWEILHGGWVSDDIQGVAQYDGKLQKPISFGNLMKWVRYQVGKVPHPQAGKPVDPNKPDSPKFPQYTANPVKHHRLSLILFSGVTLLLYTFLLQITNPTTAFLATALFVVHPLGCQTVGWISGIGYVVAAFFMFAGLNWVLFATEAPWFSAPTGVVVAVLIYSILQFCAFSAQFTSVGAAAILAWLGYWPFAIIAIAMAVPGMLHIYNDAVTLRRKNFLDQQMGASVRFHGRKFIVAAKSLQYYLRLIFFPKRMGLYHTFGYHYPLPEIEQDDKWFWLGVACATGLVGGLVTGSSTAQLAIIWFLTYIFFVLNWITVHQFVSERYAWLPSLGACLIVAAFAPEWLTFTILGVALMRTWVHIPTYISEVHFYQSNIWNFPKSEVAFGNLGVTYLRSGLAGSAVDMWRLGSQINPEYDVNWYNLASLFRSQGQLDLAKQHLERAINCKTCHFPEPWKKELEALNAAIAKKTALVKQGS